jgi:hypothetical protein
MLRALIDQQREKQQALHAALQAEGHAAPLEICLPADAPFSSARLVHQWDANGEPAFFLHIHVTRPVGYPKHIPETVIGFHEHDRGYSFAELGLDGTMIRCGDVQLPPHVDPACGAQRSDNYQYEVVHAMLREANGASIGLEETGWKKGQPALSRAHNRMVFGRPSIAIQETLQYKGRQHGVLQPRTIGNVSPTRDCSECGMRHPVGTTCLEWRSLVMCPNTECQTWNIRDEGAGEQQCTACEHIWQVNSEDLVREQYFVCPTCQQPALLARYNAAIVVAQETLCDLTRHWKNGLAYEQRKERQAAAAQQVQRASAPLVQHHAPSL